MKTGASHLKVQFVRRPYVAWNDLRQNHYKALQIVEPLLLNACFYNVHSINGIWLGCVYTLCFSQL